MTLQAKLVTATGTIEVYSGRVEILPDEWGDDLDSEEALFKLSQEGGEDGPSEYVTRLLFQHMLSDVSRREDKLPKDRLVIFGGLLHAINVFRGVIAYFVTDNIALNAKNLTIFKHQEKSGVEGHKAVTFERIDDEIILALGKDIAKTNSQIPIDREFVDGFIIAVATALKNSNYTALDEYGWVISGETEDGRKYIVSSKAITLAVSSDSKESVNIDRKNYAIWKSICDMVVDFEDMYPGTFLRDEVVGPVKQKAVADFKRIADGEVYLSLRVEGELKLKIVADDNFFRDLAAITDYFWSQSSLISSMIAMDDDDDWDNVGY